jgi:membrane-associated HD superfamily phosphohydrolase
MLIRKSNFFLLLVMVFICLGTGLAQEEKRNDPTKNMDLPETMRETFAKRRIREEEEDFQDLIKRSEEAVKISEELNKSFEESKKLTTTDTKKLEQLEKLIKKIRKDIGAEDDDDKKEDNKNDLPSNMVNTLNSIKEKSENLLAELKKTGRFAISVSAVESSNLIWRMVKFLRFAKN